MKDNIVYLNQYKKIKTIEMAENTLQDYVTYYNNDKEIDIVDILKKMNFKIILKNDFERFDNDDIALMSIHNYYLKKYNTEKLIFVNSHYSNNIIRYNLAYLLAIYILYYKGEKSFEIRQKSLINNNDKNIADSIYNLFALNILMPEEIFLNKYAEFKEKHYSDMKTTKELSKYFKVPYNKIKERYFYLNKKVEKKGKVYKFKKI